MKINDSCPLLAFITSTIAMFVSALVSIIPAGITLAIFHEIFNTEMSVKNFIIIGVVCTLIVAGVPRRKPRKEIRVRIY